MLALASFIAQPVCAADAGPGAWSTEQTWKRDNNHGGEFLKGFFYWPSTATDLNGKRALILTLHGCAQTARDDVINSPSDGGYNWKSTADKFGAVVIAPNATGNAAGHHCWDYYGTSHTRTSGHVDVLLDVVNRFVSEPKYAIDPNQVYVTGLSSGGGEVMVLGCVAPDVFAGLGNNAGPALGTTAQQIGSVPPGYTAATAAQNCKNIAPSGNYFATQIMNAIWGTSDFLVAQAYGPLNVGAMRQVYGGTFTKQPDFTVGGGGSGQQWKDANGKVRVSQIAVSGMSHAWPAGPGGQSSNFVDNAKVNYPEYITDFFFKNNLRVSIDPVPTMTSCTAAVAGDKHTVTVSGAATDNGSIVSYQVVLNGSTSISETLAGGGNFSKQYAALADGFYTGTVAAKDDKTQPSSPCNISTFLVGEPPLILPPTDVSITSTTSSLISLQWTASSGATGYNVYRNSDKVTPSPMEHTSYTDNGLKGETTYSYTVSAVGLAGESTHSSPAIPGTTKPVFTCTATTASNFAHVQNGRAHDSGGIAFANGSNENMGLDNLFFTKTLAQTSADFYIIGNCPKRDLRTNR